MAENETIEAPGLTEANLAARKAAGFPITCSELGLLMKGGGSRARVIAEKVLLRRGEVLARFENKAMQRGTEMEDDAFAVISGILMSADIEHNREFKTVELGKGLILGGTPDIVGDFVGDIKIPKDWESYERQTIDDATGVPAAYLWQLKGQALLMGRDKATLCFVHFGNEGENPVMQHFVVPLSEMEKGAIQAAIAQAEEEIAKQIADPKITITAAMLYGTPEQFIRALAKPQGEDIADLMANAAAFLNNAKARKKQALERMKETIEAEFADYDALEKSIEARLELFIQERKLDTCPEHERPEHISFRDGVEWKFKDDDAKQVPPEYHKLSERTLNKTAMKKLWDGSDEAARAKLPFAVETVRRITIIPSRDRSES